MEWKQKSSRSNVTKLVDVPSEAVSVGASISTAPGKRARIGPSPEHPAVDLGEEAPDTQYEENAPRAKRQTAVCHSLSPFNHHLSFADAK